MLKTSNLGLRKQILYGMRRVPRMGRGWKYIPLHQMPNLTQIFFETDGQSVPSESKRSLNQENEEYDVLRVPAGVYSIIVNNFPNVEFIYNSDFVENVRVLYPFLAPSSTFTANVDRPKLQRRDKDDTWSTTFRMTTLRIKSIWIPETPFILRITDGRETRSTKFGS